MNSFESVLPVEDISSVAETASEPDIQIVTKQYRALLCSGGSSSAQRQMNPLLCSGGSSSGPMLCSGGSSSAPSLSKAA